MNLQNLSALVEGTLANAPSITSFEAISFEASKVKRGDLFVALNHEEISQAILNGAYGILFEKPTQITDQEIAWIKVPSIDRALLRLLRFKILEKSPQCFSCDLISIKLASQMITSNNLLVLNKNIREHIYDLYHLDSNQYILFCDEMIDPQLFIDAKNLPEVQTSTITVVEQTLFETSFIYDDTYYERQLISPFFISYLERILQFFKQHSIAYQIRGFSAIDHFQPVFTNIHLQVKEFGKSDKVLIFERDFTLVKEQIHFLRHQANWANIIYLIPRAKEGELEANASIFYFDSLWDIMQLLKSEQYHFALIAGHSAQILDDPIFALKNEQPSLF